MLPAPIRSLVVLAIVVLSGCATEVVVEGSFPPALMRPLPASATLVFEQPFREYIFRNEGTREVSIAVGATQMDLFATIARSMFQETATLHQLPPSATTDLIIMPVVEEVQVAMPSDTQLNIFEVWIKYNIRVFAGSGQPLADWIMPAYGKTPTRFLKSDAEALNQAAIVALRDAGANLVTGFARVPEIRDWLATRPSPTAAPLERAP